MVIAAKCPTSPHTANTLRYIGNVLVLHILHALRNTRTFSCTRTRLAAQNTTIQVTQCVHKHCSTHSLLTHTNKLLCGGYRKAAIPRVEKPQQKGRLHWQRKLKWAKTWEITVGVAVYKTHVYRGRMAPHKELCSSPGDMDRDSEQFQSPHC